MEMSEKKDVREKRKIKSRSDTSANSFILKYFMPKAGLEPSGRSDASASYAIHERIQRMQRSESRIPGTREEQNTTTFATGYLFIARIVDARSLSTRRPRLKIFGKRRFNNFQDLPKSTENIVQTHDWRGFFANVPTENG